MNKNELAKQIVAAIKVGWYEHSKPFTASTSDCTIHWLKEIDKTIGWIDIKTGLPTHEMNEAIQVVVKIETPSKKYLSLSAVYYNKCFYDIETWRSKGVHSTKITNISKWMYLPE